MILIARHYPAYTLSMVQDLSDEEIELLMTGLEWMGVIGRVQT